MSRLVRFYPMTWRRRYEAEMLQLLDKRPRTPREALDLIRGAIDAHLHPELVSDARQPWTHRIPGLLATSAGLIWASFWVRALLVAPGEEWGDGFGIAVLLMFLCVPGDYMLANARQIAIGVVAAISGIVLAWSLPWSIGDGLLNGAAGATACLVVGGGMLGLAAMRAGIGRRGRWIVTAGAVLLPAAIATPILIGIGAAGLNNPVALLGMVLPYGIAWMLIGLRMTLRGSATITDPPNNVFAQEVHAQ